MRKIIDFRVRPPFKSILDMFLYRDPEDWTLPLLRSLDLEPDSSYTKRSLDLFVAELAATNVVRAVIPGNIAEAPASAGGSSVESINHEDIVELVDSYPDLFTGMIAVEPGVSSSADEAEALLKSGKFHGIEIDPGLSATPMYPDDPRAEWVYELAEEYKVPMVVKLSHQMGPDMSYGQPHRLAPAAAKHPTVNFVICHAGWPWITEAIAVAGRYSNVYLQPDFYIAFPGRDMYIEAANTILKDRFVYASSYPVMPILGMRSILDDLKLSPESRRKTEYDNAARLLDL